MEHGEIKPKQIKTSTGLVYSEKTWKAIFFIDKQCEWKMSTSSIYNQGWAKKMHLNVDVGSVFISVVCEGSVWFLWDEKLGKQVGSNSLLPESF